MSMMLMVALQLNCGYFSNEDRLAGRDAPVDLGIYRAGRVTATRTTRRHQGTIETPRTKSHYLSSVVHVSCDEETCDGTAQVSISNWPAHGLCHGVARRVFLSGHRNRTRLRPSRFTRYGRESSGRYR